MMMKKVFLIRSHPIDPDVRIEKEAKVLTNAGYSVTIIGWGRYGKNVSRVQQKEGYSIERFLFKAPWGKRVVIFLPIWFIFEFIRLKKNDWDVLHAADFDTLLPALFLAKIRKKPIIYDIFDFYSEQILHPKILNKVIKHFESFFLQFADVIIIVDPSRLKQLGLNKTPLLEIIYNSPPDFFKKNPPTNLKYDNYFRIFYAGVLSPDRDFLSLINAGLEFDNVIIEIAGYGFYEKEIRTLAKNNSRISFLGQIPYEKVIEKTIQSDLLFALYDPKMPNNQYASPNKLFEAMMCGKPILISDETNMANIVKEENCGLIIPFGDLNAIKKALFNLIYTPDLCKKLGDNGRKAYESKYNWGIMEQKLLKVYAQVEISYGNDNR